VLFNNGRIYKIHINIQRKASNFDIMKSYYFARLLDEELYQKQGEGKIDTNKIEQSIRAAEIMF